MNEKYEKMTKKELIDTIESLHDRMNDVLRDQNNQMLVNFPWAGNLGQWYWDFVEDEVIFNDKKVSSLGYDPKAIGKVGFKFFTDKLHPDDYDHVMDNMRKHLYGQNEAYEVEYRIQHKEGHYIWYYDRGIITKRDEAGKPLFLQGIVFDITESKKIEEKLIHLSERDGLTNVYNRRAMFNHLDKLIQTHQIYDQTFSLIMFDIDHFKKVNDHFGHLGGDDVLRRLTHLIVEDKRLHDLLCRYGGEEFFLILPDTNISGAKELAKRLHNLIRKMEIPKVESITVSMGVVEHRKDEHIDEVVKRVDDLVYEAKRAGRDTIKFE
jgi:diguanylate cyclase (GGDEF)-like protein/PAS domain S-box-containing protein